MMINYRFEEIDSNFDGIDSKLDRIDNKLDKVYDQIEVLLGNLIVKKSLSEYGVNEEKLEEFTERVMEKQEKLMANNHIKLDREQVYHIYKSLYK